MGCKQITSNKPRNNNQTKENNDQFDKADRKDTAIVEPNNEDIKIVLKSGDKIIKTMSYPVHTKTEVVIKDIENYIKQTIDTSNVVVNGKNLSDGKDNDLNFFLKNNETGWIIDLTSETGLLTSSAIEEYTKTKLIGKLSREDKLELLVFDKELHNLTSNIIKGDNSKELIEHYSEFSAVCNGRDVLYVSGGVSALPIKTDINQTEPENIILDHFFKISLETGEVFKQKDGLANPRKWHSMIYIPKNYVLIVGGIGVKKVEVYNEKEDTIKEHSELNDERAEPTLALIDNCNLYAFSGFKNLKENINTFEKINLKGNYKLWEIINIKFEDNAAFTQMFFAVTYYGNNKVLFLGGMQNQNKDSSNKNNFCFTFDYHQNLLKLSDIPNINLEFEEKFMLPISNTASVAFPNLNKEELELVYFDQSKINTLRFELESTPNANI